MASKILRKLNILEINANLGYAGGQRNMVTFAKYFRKDFFNVTVCAYYTGGLLESVLVDHGIDYLVANGNVEEILKIVERKNIDIIHMHRSGQTITIESAIVKGARKINPKLVFVEKNVFGKYDPSLEGEIDCSMFQSMMHLNERYLPKSGKIFNFSTQKVLGNMVDREEFDQYKVSSAEIINFKKINGINEDDFVIGKVGRPALEKWSDLIIEMVPHLLSLLPHFKIIIIGCPPSRESVIKKSKFKCNFIFLSETKDQKDLHIFYQSIDVLAHSSKIGECNGNTINEAMFWGKPVIVNSTPKKDNGQLEQVIHLKNGIIANNPYSFARAVAFLASNPSERNRMAEAAHQQILSDYDPRSVTMQMEKVFTEKAAQKGVEAALSIAQEYASIPYRPSAEEIVNYKLEYQKRLRWDYGEISSKERLWLFMLFPRRLYYKLKDFALHKWQSYVRK